VAVALLFAGRGTGEYWRVAIDLGHGPARGTCVLLSTTSNDQTTSTLGQRD
jgi:hypothetical protein